MAEDNKNNNKSDDLDAILSDINFSIKKEVSKTVKFTQNDKPKNDKPKNNKKKPPQKPKPKPEKKKDDFLMAAINSTFVESAKIIEDSVEEALEEPIEVSDRPVRFIQVTASEVVEDSPIIKKEKAPDTAPINSYPSAPAPIEEKPETKPPSPEVSRDANRHIQKARKKKLRHKITKRKKISAILGAVMTLFFIIGIVSTCVVTVNFTKNSLNHTAQKQELEKEIFPFVIVDIPEFDDPKKLDNSVIISSAIWEFIIDEEDKTKYEKDEMNFIYVPAVDIEHYVRRLYGNDVTVTHQNVDDQNIMMTYEPEGKMYIIESAPKYLTYKPRVDKIKAVKDIYTLDVSYMLPNAMWNLGQETTNDQASKTMQYVLKKDKDNYQVLSVKLLSVSGMTSSDALLMQQATDDAADIAIDDDASSDLAAVSSQIEAAISAAPTKKATSSEVQDAGSSDAGSNDDKKNTATDETSTNE